MKKGARIPVSSMATKGPQRMAWTETQTGRRVTRAPERFYHSSDSLIRTFAETQICTFGQRQYGGPGYVYEITVPAGTVIAEYGNESRFALHAGCSVRYVGRRFYRYGKSWRPGKHPTIVDTTIE